MSLHIDWRYLDGALFDDLTEYFEKFELAVTMNAEEGSVGASTVTLYDPTAALDIIGLSHFRVYEMDAPAGQQCIGQYYAADSRVHRGDSERVTVQRVWDINLVDINTVMSYRVFDETRANRPAETDVARIQWLLGTTDFGLVDDSRYFSTASNVAMDAVDYRGQTPHSVLDDCAQQSGKNFYLWYAEDVDTYSLWYDFAISSNYSSTISLSNVLADVDYSTVFAISQDTELKRDPSRLYTGVYLPYDGGAVYVRSTAALAGGDYPQRDFVAPSVNVKTRAKALARARRYLRDLDTEEDVITTTFIVPRAQVNDLMQGMRVQIKASHLPGYSDYVWMRCVNRTVKEYNEDEYAITVELMAPKPPTVYPSAYAILHRSAGPFDGNVVWWDSNGDNPDPGFASAPTGAGLSIWEPVNPPAPDRPYRGILVTGTGTIDVTFHASVVGVLIDNIVFSITWAIRKNGVVVASQAQNVSGFLQFLWVEQTVTIAGLEVEPGDEIDATIVSIPPTLPFFKTPGGAGQAGERLEVTGGTLV